MPQSSFEGSPAFSMSNGELVLTVLQQGASFASVVLQDDAQKLNPLWDSVAGAVAQGRPAKPNASTGHFLCVDGFGPPSPQGKEAGMPFCGEAHTVVFQAEKQDDATTQDLTLTATLPLVQESLTRTVRMVQGENIVYVETHLRNLMGFDRPVQWGEHATVGSPFVQPGDTVFNQSGSRSKTTSYTDSVSPMDPKMVRRLASDAEFTWPMAPGRGGTPVDLSQTPPDPHYIDNSASLLDPARPLAWATVTSPHRRLVIGYLFREQDYPWMHVWGNYPPAGQLAHAFEFATQPFPSSPQDALTGPALFGIPSDRWLPAKSEIESRYLMFYARVPDGFGEVDSVTLQGTTLLIEDRAAHKEIRLTASRGL